MDIDIKHSLLEFLPNTVENIRKNYNLNDGRMKQSVDILDDWIKKQPHFLNKNFSPRYLEVIIISCKGSVEKAKKQIDKLCTFKTLLPKYFENKGVLRICENVIKVGTVITFPKMTKQYQRVFMIKISNKPLTSSDLLDYYRLALVFAEYSLAHDYMDGIIIIEDLRDANLVDLVTSINFIELQEYMTILTEGFGARMQGIHMITQSKAVDVFVKTLKSFLSEKIANRIHVHPEIEDLHKIVDKEILPVDFGGEERSIDEIQDEWIKLISSEETEKYLEETRASGTDESLRQTDKFNEQYLGKPGSFRTLTVD